MAIRLLSAATLLALTAAALPVATSPATAAETHREPRPLERLFNNTAISDDARPGEADLDGSGASLSAQDLAAAGWTPGQELAIDSARLNLPRSSPGRPDNVIADGQQISLSGRGNAVSFLVAGSSPDGAGGKVSGTGTISYRNGSTSTFTLAAADWRSGPLSTKAVALPHLNTFEGQRAEPVRLYAVTVPVERGESISSVRLPHDPGPDADLHVFAASVRPEAGSWSGSWSASTSGYAPVGPWNDRTLRLVVHTSSGGPRARIRLANTFAAAPVRIGQATIALQGEGAGSKGRPVPLTFGGKDAMSIPAGVEAISDPVGFQVPAGANLLISIHLPETVTAAPIHSLAVQKSYISADGSGDRTADGGAEAFTGELGSWPFLTGVDTAGGPGSVLTLGDSITDGQTSTVGGNQRWPDVLARRLQSQSEVPRYGVLNHGISANRIASDVYLGDGVSTKTGGVSAGNRLERDVLAQTSARTLVVYEGINDVRWGATTEQVIDGLHDIAARARARDLRVVVATIAPCEGFSLCTPESEAKRIAVNDFIRGAGPLFDAVLDFDAVLRDPEHPQRMLPAYDSGDHIHPGDAGLRALGESVDLKLLAP